jgi:hypothetical protein
MLCFLAVQLRAGPLPQTAVPQPQAAVSGTADKTTRVATGKVTQQKCTAKNIPELTVTTDSGVLLLRFGPGQFSLVAPDWKSDARFDACSSLRGLRVEVSYLPLEKGGRYEGEVRLVTILPAEKPAITLAVPTPATADAAKPGGGAVPPGKPATTAEGANATPAQPSAERPLGAPPPHALIAEGEVTKVSCDSENSIFVTVLSKGSPLKLHRQNFMKVEFLTVDSKQLDADKVFQPCTDLLGKAVKILYARTHTSDWAGEIYSIELK